MNRNYSEEILSLPVSFTKVEFLKANGAEEQTAAGMKIFGYMVENMVLHLMFSVFAILYKCHNNAV